jgi:hypothetical protein
MSAIESKADRPLASNKHKFYICQPSIKHLIFPNYCGTLRFYVQVGQLPVSTTSWLLSLTLPLQYINYNVFRHTHLLYSVLLMNDGYKIKALLVSIVLYTQVYICIHQRIPTQSNKILECTQTSY